MAVDPNQTVRIDQYDLAVATALATAVSPYEKQIRFLHRTSAFRSLPREILEQVAAALESRSFQAGEVICREGDQADQFCIIETGTVSIRTVVGDQEYELARLGPGESFGEVALLRDSVRTATVMAATPVRLSVLPAALFSSLLARSPQLAETMHAIANIRDRASSDQQERQDLATLLQEKSVIRIGREIDNDIVINNASVSRYHASLRIDHDACQLFDSSTHGTFVNGTQVRGSAVLRDGDEIVIADERFVFDRRGTVRVVEATGIRIDALHLTREVKGGKRLLHDVSLSILAGEFVAIVGGSGAGKTTLMDALSGVRPATGGQVLYNGRDYYSNMNQHRQTLGYVPQDDIIHHELTLRRTFHHAAKLRLPRDTKPAAIDQAIESTFAELGLTERADLRVGALSGGQRKRASIGIELLTEPRIFFLDEPTSGLDPATDAQIMRSLRALADGGRTVILTTHATKNVMLCDRIIILAKDGHLAFVGPPADALRFFNVTSFDEIYELLAERGTPAEWGEYFRQSPDWQLVLQEQLSPSDSPATREDGPKSRSRTRRGLRHHVHELTVLSRRNFALHTRSVGDIMPIVMMPVLLGVLLLTLFSSGIFDVGSSNPAAALQLVFLLSFTAFLLGLLASIQEIVKELPIFFRERNVGVAVVPYLISKITFLVPVVVFGVVVLIGTPRLTNRLPAAGLSVLAPLFLSLFLSGVCGISAGLLTSASVKSSQQANDYLPMWIMPQVLFAGALFAVPAMAAVGRFISNFAAVRWAFEAAGNALDLTTVFTEDHGPVGASLLNQYGTSFTDAPGKQWIILAAFAIVPLVIATIVLRKRQPRR